MEWSTACLLNRSPRRYRSLYKISVLVSDHTDHILQYFTVRDNKLKNEWSSVPYSKRKKALCEQKKAGNYTFFMPQMLFSVYLGMQMFYFVVEEVGKHHFTHFHKGVAIGILMSWPTVYTLKTIPINVQSSLNLPENPPSPYRPLARTSGGITLY